MTALHLLRPFSGWQRRDANGRRFAIETVDGAEEWVAHIAGLGFDCFTTWTARAPARADELEGGSVYFCRARRTLFRMPWAGLEYDDRHHVWAILMRPEIVRVEAKRVGIVCGWRYLEGRNAPADRPRPATAVDGLPRHVARELRETGLA